MRNIQQLALIALTITSPLALTAYGISHQSSIKNAPALFERDDTANYVVYGKDTKNQEQATAVYKLLKSLTPDPTKIYNSTTGNGTQHWFWAVPLTSANAENVKGDSNVAAVARECTSNCYDPIESDNEPSFTRRSSGDNTNYTGESRLVKRDGQTVNAHNVDDEVAFISRPLRSTPVRDFVYDNTAGTDQTIYIVDTGAGLGNTDEFSRYVTRNKKYLQARGASENDGLENDVSRQGHGTGLLAKAVGWKHGIAKRSKPVIVRVSKGSDPGAWLNGVQQAYDDWLPVYNANKKTATAVLNLSWGWTVAGLEQSGYPGSVGKVWMDKLAQLLNKCIDIGLLPIVPSGNGFSNPSVNQYPQLFAYHSDGKPPAVPNMMVVGGVTVPDGNLWERSKVDPPGTNPPVIMSHAPSFLINVPEPDGGWRNPYEVQGVSYAAATISGLGIYFLGLSSLSGNFASDNPVQRVANLKRQLESGSAIPRGNVPSLYNLADPRTCPPGLLPPGFQDGDEVPCGGTSTVSGNTVVAIPNCYITTAFPIPSLGITTPLPMCSCTGHEIAGINSGTVSGTTYSWCATGGLPSGVPTEATAQPTAQLAAQPTSQAPAPGPTQSCSVQVESGLRGIILGYRCICNIRPTPTPTIIDHKYTCPTTPPAKERDLESR